MVEYVIEKTLHDGLRAGAPQRRRGIPAGLGHRDGDFGPGPRGRLRRRRAGIQHLAGAAEHELAGGFHRHQLRIDRGQSAQSQTVSCGMVTGCSARGAMKARAAA